jgi:hypothetical protein
MRDRINSLNRSGFRCKELMEHNACPSLLDPSVMIILGQVINVPLSTLLTLSQPEYIALGVTPGSDIGDGGCSHVRDSRP